MEIVSGPSDELGCVLRYLSYFIVLSCSSYFLVSISVLLSTPEIVLKIYQLFFRDRVSFLFKLDEWQIFSSFSSQLWPLKINPSFNCETNNFKEMAFPL